MKNKLDLENKYETNVELNENGEEIIWLDEFQRWFSFNDLEKLKNHIFNTYFKIINLEKDWKTVKEKKGRN